MIYKIIFYALTDMIVENFCTGSEKGTFTKMKENLGANNEIISKQ